MLKAKFFSVGLIIISMCTSFLSCASLPSFSEDEEEYNGEIVRHLNRLQRQIEARIDYYQGKSIQYLPLETVYTQCQELSKKGFIPTEDYINFLKSKQNLFYKEDIDIITIPVRLNNIFRNEYSIFILPRNLHTIQNYALNLKEQLSQICQRSLKKGVDNLTVTRLLKRISLICNSNVIYNPLTKFLEEESATLKWVGVLNPQVFGFTAN